MSSTPEVGAALGLAVCASAAPPPANAPNKAIVNTIADLRIALSLARCLDGVFVTLAGFSRYRHRCPIREHHRGPDGDTRPRIGAAHDRSHVIAAGEQPDD